MASKSVREAVARELWHYEELKPITGKMRLDEYHKKLWRRRRNEANRIIKIVEGGKK